MSTKIISVNTVLTLSTLIISRSGLLRGELKELVSS